MIPKKPLTVLALLILGSVATISATVGRSATAASLFSALPDEQPTVAATPQGPLHHRHTATPIATVTPTVTTTPTAAPSTAPSPTATAMPSGGAGPQILAPTTGDASSDGDSLPLAPIALTCLLGATALTGAAYVSRTSRRRR